VVHLAPGNDQVAALFAKLAPVERDVGCTVPADTSVGRRDGRGDVRRFPSRPITLTLPWAAGGATDVGARILAPLLGRELGQAVVVANCDEAQTPEAFARLAEMPADGYHLLFINEPSFEMAVGRPAHAMQPPAFRLLASQAFDPIGAFVRADSPYATLGDLLRDARSRDAMLTVGTSGPRTPAHLGAVMLEERTGLRFRYRHYRGSLEHVARFLAGQTDVAFFGSGITLPALRAGELRALAMFTPERFHLLPEVPTTGDAGLASLVLASTRGLWVPAGVPAPVFRTLKAAVIRALRDDAHIRQMHASGLGVSVMEGRVYEQYQDAQSMAYGRFARTLSIV
jgi:tripartite-type tricarboxylate transporter receptor subunit TctC